jgi:hypothetical protein
MKSLLLLLGLLMAAATMWAQAISEQYIPEVLIKKMEEMYPAAKGTYWKQPMPGFMDAYFTLNKKKCNATFQAGGAWISTEFEVEPQEFPETARQYLAVNSSKVTRYYRSESKAKGTQYAADAKTENGIMQFIFTSEGSYLMKGTRD